jgi:hypothetical protein
MRTGKKTGERIVRLMVIGITSERGKLSLVSTDSSEDRGNYRRPSAILSEVGDE